MRVEGDLLRWSERHLVVRSLKLAQAQTESLQRKVERTVQDITALQTRKQGKERLDTLEKYQQAVAQVFKRYGTVALVRVDYQVSVAERQVRQYKERPPRIAQNTQIALSATVDDQAVAARSRTFGWRVYATNASAGELPLHRALLAYREQYTEEQAFGRLKGKTLCLTPMYLERDDHATGLVRLLSIGLRVLTLTEYTVRQALQTSGMKLSALFAGNPKRTTNQPTAERLLAAFKDIILTVIHEPASVSRYLTPLSHTQARILQLMGFSDLLYLSLAFDDS